MLEIKDIYKKYNNRIVLENINFKINQGVVGIIGPNGAGKTTLLKIISGFETGDRGIVSFNGKILTNLKEKIKLISYMPQWLELYPDWYVYDFIKFIKKINNIDERVIKALNIDKEKHKKIKILSSGYKQRLKLFFALSENKKIMILDEPFNEFDPLQILKIIKLIKQKKKENKIFLIAIHQLNIAEKVCDYFVLLNSGKIVTKGDKNTLKRKYPDKNNSIEKIFIKALK